MILCICVNAKSRNVQIFWLTCPDMVATLEKQQKAQACTAFSGLYVCGQRREMNVPSSQHPDKLIREAVASMAGGWKATLLKFGATPRSRVQVGDTFSVPLVSFQPSWPGFPTLWPDSLSFSQSEPSTFALIGFLKISKLAILMYQQERHV